MMKNKFHLPDFNLNTVVNGAVGSFGPYCMGYMNPGNSGLGYIASMKLSVDKVAVEGLDTGTEGIVSYDRCEKNDAYIGQINMETASSFCGVNGALWGYHLATADSIKDGSLQPMFTYPGPLYPEHEKLPQQGPVPVYPVGPLLDAAVRLFGRMDRTGDGQTDRRRFPPMPGAHVICANKDSSGRGPGYFWSIIGIAIAKDRDTSANLFIEDADVIKPREVEGPGGKTIKVLPTREEVHNLLEEHMRNVAKSMVLCGQDQDVVYEKIFLGVKYIFAGKDEVGCALTCAPYVVLARDAVPTGGPASNIINMTISEWEKSLGLEPLPPLPPVPGTGSIGC